MARIAFSPGFFGVMVSGSGFRVVDMGAARILI